MKAGWEVKKLGEVCGYFNGVAHEHCIDENGKYKLINSKFISSDGLNFKSSSLGLFLLKRGDITMCLSDVPNGKTLAKCFLVDKDETYTLNQRICVVRSTRMLEKFLYYQLNRNQHLLNFDNGENQTNLRLNQVLECPLYLPPISEQQRIVAILDQAFEGIAKARANAQQNLQNARALFESHLQSVFTQRGKGWMKNKLDSLTTKIGSGATPRGGEESYKAEGISLVRSMNVHDFGFKYAKLAFLDDAQAKELSNVELKPNDVLLNITGASVARCCIVPEDVLPARVNQHVSIIRPVSDKLDSSFLHYLLLSKPYKDKLLQTGSEGGSTRQAITKAQIQEFLIEYPPAIEDQKAIAHKLNEMLKETQRLETLYQRKITLLDELKKSLLQQAFAGEL